MSEGTKKTTGAGKTTTELLEAEVKGERVSFEMNGVFLEVNPKAPGSGPALRALQQLNNPWPMYELLVPDEGQREALEASLPQDPELGWDIEDFMKMFSELMERSAGKKA